MEALTKAVEQQREVLDKYVGTLKSLGASDAEQLYSRIQRIQDLFGNAKGANKTALQKLFSEAANEARAFANEWQALGEQMQNQKGWSEAKREMAAAKAELEGQLAIIKEFHNKAIPGYAASDYSAAISYVESMYDETIAKIQAKQQAAALAVVKAETELLRKVTDEKIALIEDENERALATEETRHARAIDDLETRLETEKDLTLTQRAAINNLIELEEQKHQRKMLELDNKAQEEKRKADEKALEERIAAANKETQAMMDLVKLEWENRINEAANKGQQTLQMEIDAAKARMDALQQLEGESDADFKARQLEAEREYIDAKKALNDYELEIEQAKYDALSGMVGGLSSIMEAFGEENEALAKASKILALAEIAISTGKAIAAGVAQAQSVPFPANLAAIGTTVATVLANIATAVSTVKSAKFATGGLVTGPGSSTSDSIPAQLSNGESVMNARTTSMFGPLLSTLNQAGGGIAFNPGLGGQREGYEFLASAVAAGMERVNLHVGVDEITRVQDRVAQIKDISTI